MKIRGAREHSVAVALAVLGALLCATSLLLPWQKINESGLQQWILTSPLFAQQRAQTTMTPDQVAAGIGFATSMIGDALAPQLKGLRFLSVLAVAGQLIGAAVVAGSVLRFVNQQLSRVQLAALLLIGGGWLLFRPIAANGKPPEIKNVPLVGDLDFLAPALGIYVAGVGAALILIAGMLVGLHARENDQREAAEATAAAALATYSPPPPPAMPAQP